MFLFAFQNVNTDKSVGYVFVEKGLCLVLNVMLLLSISGCEEGSLHSVRLISLYLYFQLCLILILT